MGHQRWGCTRDTSHSARETETECFVNKNKIITYSTSGGCNPGVKKNNVNVKICHKETAIVFDQRCTNREPYTAQLKMAYFQNWLVLQRNASVSVLSPCTRSPIIIKMDTKRHNFHK